MPQRVRLAPFRSLSLSSSSREPATGLDFLGENCFVSSNASSKQCPRLAGLG
jgi:hypothetical protein